MSIVLYSKYRRMKLRAARELAGMAVWCKEVGKYIAWVFLALVAVQYITDKTVAADEAEEKTRQIATHTEKLELAWISCLEHKGVWINDRLHICTVADTHFKQGDFK